MHTDIFIVKNQISLKKSVPYEIDTLVAFIDREKEPEKLFKARFRSVYSEVCLEDVHNFSILTLLHPGEQLKDLNLPLWLARDYRM